MKITKNFKINPQKIIDNEELVNLRGGYDSGTWKQLYCNQGANPPFANPQPCKFYETAQDMVDDCEQKCYSADCTFWDCNL